MEQPIGPNGLSSPWGERAPAWSGPGRRRADERLPVPVAARIIAASTLGLWVGLWKLAELLM